MKFSWGLNDEVVEKTFPTQRILQNLHIALGIFCPAGVGTPETTFLATPRSICDRFFYQVQKYSKFVTHGPSTCRDITQNSDFEKSKIGYKCIYIVNFRNRKFTISENLQCKCSYKRFSDFSKSVFWVMSPHVEGPFVKSFEYF